MKKLLLGVTVGASLLVVFFLTIIMTNNHHPDYRFFTIKTCNSFCYKEGRTVKLSFYLNQKDTLLDFPETVEAYITNQSEEKLLKLKLCSLEWVEKFHYREDTYYQYILISELPNPGNNFLIEDAFLKVSCKDFILKGEIGLFEVIYESKNDSSLVVKDQYGIFNEVVNQKTLVGLVLTLENLKDEDVIITDLVSATSIKLSPSLIEIIDKEIFTNEYNLRTAKDYSYFYSDEIEDKNFVIEANERVDILVPFKYQDLVYIDNVFLKLIMNDEELFIDNFQYGFHFLDMVDYQPVLKEGKYDRIS